MSVNSSNSFQYVFTTNQAEDSEEKAGFSGRNNCPFWPHPENINAAKDSMIRTRLIEK